MRRSPMALDGCKKPGMEEACHSCLTEAGEILQSLDEYWNDEGRFLRKPPGCRQSGTRQRTRFRDDPCSHPLLAGRRGRIACTIPRSWRPWPGSRICSSASYEINRNRPEHLGPALGRYAGDKYFSGGAYYFSTLGAAEFYYSLAEAVAAGAGPRLMAGNTSVFGSADCGALPEDADHQQHFEALLRRGDQFMATVAAYTPASGELSEQFDQATGAQTSAKSLAWSHAAFITAFAPPEGRLAGTKPGVRNQRGAMIDKLEFLIALARERNFSRAADSLRRDPAHFVGRHQTA